MTTDLLHDLLNTLGQARHTLDFIETEIKRLEAPHLEAAKQASERYRAVLKSAKEAEEQANARAQTEYTARNVARLQSLIEGHETTGIQIPDGWSVQLRTKLEIADPDMVPRELCVPDPKAVSRRLKAGDLIPGAALVASPVFVRRSK